MLNDKELRIFQAFKEEILDRYGCDSCNDWNFPKGWSDKEKLAFSMRVAKHCKVDLDDIYKPGRKYGPCNTLVLQYLLDNIGHD